MKNFKERLNQYANDLIPKAAKLVDDLHAVVKAKKTNLENELDEKINSDYTRFCSNALYNKFEVDTCEQVPADVCAYIKLMPLAFNSVLTLRLLCKRGSTGLTYIFQVDIDGRVQSLSQNDNYSLIVEAINKWSHFNDEYHCEESTDHLNMHLPPEQFRQFLKERGHRLNKEILDKKKAEKEHDQLVPTFNEIVNLYGFTTLATGQHLVARKDIDSGFLTISFDLKTQLFSIAQVHEFSDSEKASSGFNGKTNLDVNLQYADFIKILENLNKDLMNPKLTFDHIGFLVTHDFSLKSHCDKTYTYKNLKGYNLLINPTNAQLNREITFDLTLENFSKFHEAIANIHQQTELLKSLGK